jgi:hypothetical protein
MRVEILGRSKQPGINVVAAVQRSVGHALDRSVVPNYRHTDRWSAMRGAVAR